MAGKYTIQGVLRRHPWATTYSAITAPNREVAIKVLDIPAAARPKVMAAFHSIDAVAAAIPAHLALQVPERGEDAEAAAPFVITALSANPSLDQLVELCPFLPDEMVPLMTHLGEALDEARAVGIVHLALKPTNIFVGPSPEYHVQLVDFGANALRSTFSEDERLSFEGPWLPPEQVHGDAGAGAAADVFAAALVAFVSLTGKSFWRAGDGQGWSLAAWRAEITAPRALASVRAAEIGVT